MDNNSQFLDKLWNTIDHEMTLRRCEVFSYTPDNEDDPFSDGALWSFNFFFYNKDIRRMCYFSCIATRYFILFKLLMPIVLYAL